MANPTHEVVAMALALELPTRTSWFDRLRQTVTAPAKPALDAPTRALLAKRDDRLLRDIGLSRAALLGQDAVVFDDLAQRRRLWQL